MSVRSLNGLASGDTNVYINTNLTATLPLEENQSSFNNPIVISMKGLSGFGGAGKVIKVNSANNALEYADDNTENITASLPLLRTGDVLSLKGLTTLGTANQIIKMNSGGTALEYANDNTENITTSLPLLRTGDNITLKGLSTLGTANQIIKMNSGGTALEYADDNTENITASLPLLRTGDNITLKGLSTLGSANQIIKMNSGGTQLEYANETDTIYTGSTNIDITNEVISITGTIPTGNGGTGITSYLGGDLIIGAGGIGPPNALTRLAIGTNGYVLKSNGSLPVWDAESVFDSTLATNFGTAVAGGNTISLGNSQNSGQSTNVDIYTSTVLNIKNTSGAIVATLSPVSSTCNLDLKGGVITTATLSTNTTWNGSTIAYNYGGTGLSSLTASKILQVNAGANGYNLVDLPVGNTYTGSTNINVSGTNVISLTGTIPISNGGTNISSLTGNATKILQVNAGATGYDLINIPSSSNWTLSSGNLYPIATSTDVLIGTTTNTDNDKFLVQGSTKLVGTATISDIVIPNNGNIDFFENTSFGTNKARLRCNSNFVSDLTITLPITSGVLLCDADTIPRQNGGTGLSIIGTAGQVLSVNSSGTALEYSTPSVGSSIFQSIASLISPINDVNGFRCSNNRFISQYDGAGATYIYNGAYGSASYAGCFLSHQDSYRLALNNASPSSSSTSSHIDFTFRGVKRAQMTGSETEALKFFQLNGSTVYAVMGRASTFPSNMSYWSAKAVPGGNAFFIGGTNTNDSEGFFLTMNGNQMGISNPGDTGALNFYDEDGGQLRWQITQAGSLVPISDGRVKKNITHYKNSSFEKYKQIRTVSYTQVIPKNINPLRLKKQSCLDKFNNLQYGIIAQEIFELYPELENSEGIRERKVFYSRKENWNNGVYEKEHKEWVVNKEEFESDKKEEEYKEKEPQKIFDEEEPIRKFEYNRLSILTIGVVQDIIKENETMKEKVSTLETELDTYKSIVNKLMNATSFKSFKESIA